MPPPKSKPAPTAQATGPVPVPDPKNVKELFMLREKLAARLNAEKKDSNAGNVNSNETSGYSAESGSKNSENVLPKIKTVPAEADLIPPKTYKAIVANKKNKEKVGTIGGITSGQDPVECGSFYNSSDNRVARSVYKEDLLSMSVTSLSFNPKNWMRTACPKSHSVVEEGGRGGVDGRPVIIVTDQNFPAVLPSAGNRCLAIMRMEQASTDDLADMFIKFAKKRQFRKALWLSLVL
jgi:hypothetical protein